MDIWKILQIKTLRIKTWYNIPNSIISNNVRLKSIVNILFIITIIFNNDKNALFNDY